MPRSLHAGRRTQLYEKLQALAKPYLEVEELLTGGKEEDDAAASTSSKTQNGIPPSTLMVDFDEVAWTCLGVWYEQMEADKVGGRCVHTSRVRGCHAAACPRAHGMAAI